MPCGWRSSRWTCVRAPARRLGQDPRWCTYPTTPPTPTPPPSWSHPPPARRAAHPVGHLKAFRGTLQADAYAGYHPFYEGGEVVEAACWSHARRKMWDIHERQHKLAGTLAHQALQRIGVIFQIEAQIRG